MRTTITIPDKTLHDIMTYTHAKSRTEAVNQAIQDWIRLKKIQQIKALQGKITIDLDVKELRYRDMKRLEKQK